MKNKFYILYKTTNIKNNKFYIGVHETYNLEDGYLGSGKKFKNSLYYHGKENFKREILEYFNNSTEMYQREREIVTEEFIKNPKCMNLTLGGNGGWPSEQQRLNSIKSNRKQKELWNTDLEWRNKKSKNMTNAQLKSYENGRERIYFYDWNGKSHSEETKKKIGEANSKHQKGINNSQYGTCWITNGTINKKIYKDDEIPEGFKLGRKFNLPS